MVPTNLDHLHVAAADLEQGMNWVEERIGVRPVPGGSHPRYGTCNAILALGPSRYLEVIAPDPSIPAPRRGRLFDPPPGKPRLAWWVLRAENIEDTRAAALQRGLMLGEIQEGERARPDGSMVRWKLTDPYVRPLGGAVPFLIAWGATPHPAGTAPDGGILAGFRIHTPRPGDVTDALMALGAKTSVSRGKAVRLFVSIETATGTVELG